MSYHVSLPQDVFLSKIPNVPLKKYPLHVSDASWILRPAHVCGGVKRGRQTLLRPMRTRQSAKSPRVKKERIVCAPRSRRFDQWRTTRRWFAASSTTRSSFSSSSSSYPDPPFSSCTLVDRAPSPFNCQSCCNDLEKASFERSHGWKRHT